MDAVILVSALAAILAAAALAFIVARHIDHLHHRIDQQERAVGVALTVLEAHLDGKHVEVHSVTEDGTPIRETEEE